MEKSDRSRIGREHSQGQVAGRMGFEHTRRSSLLSPGYAKNNVGFREIASISRMTGMGRTTADGKGPIADCPLLAKARGKQPLEYDVQKSQFGALEP
jgi:hypothetical protein